MPSLRKRVSSYFRQLSFNNETRDKRHNINENSFVTKYLQGHITLKDGPPIIYGKSPTDLPNYELGKYETGSNSIIGCYTGPNGGLTTVKRTEKHLSVLDADIDYIDTTQDEAVHPKTPPKKSPHRSHGQPVDNTKMIIKVGGQEYCVTNQTKRHSKSLSLGSISDFNVEIEKTKIDKEFYNNNSENVICKNTEKKNVEEKNQTNILSDNDCDKNGFSEGQNESFSGSEEFKNGSVTKKMSASETGRKISNQISKRSTKNQRSSDNFEKKTQTTKIFDLSKSKSDINPFDVKKKGKIIKIAQRPNIRAEESSDTPDIPFVIDDLSLPGEWNIKNDRVYGISDSLYDRNQVTKNKNGDPIADCFGIIARNDSAILAVADGVNWGEKACIAAKSAVHGCLHYLNKTIFNDTTPFDNLTIKTDDITAPPSINTETYSGNLMSNTREVFVCLLRAFNCAHDLILENKGMLTTLTVAVVLPLKQKILKKVQDGTAEEQPKVYETRYICCVCNVGDTLAYVYSHKYGVRELTKGSHDIHCNRDMRDALGALGPVDGINPELSNLTLSVTTLQKGDIVMVASDGLTDNFDPNVCKFTVNSNLTEQIKPVKRPSTTTSGKQTRVIEQKPRTDTAKNVGVGQKPPVKPPRRSKAKEDSGSRSSTERTSIRSNDTSEKSTSPSVENLPIVQAPEPLENEKHPVDYNNPLVAQFMRENSVDQSSKPAEEPKAKPTVVENKASSLRRQASSQVKQETLNSSHKASGQQRPIITKTSTSKRQEGQTTGYKFLRSKTTLDFRSSNVKHISRNEDGIPYVTPIQRYELQLLLIEDILRNGISGSETQCTSAKRLCENLVSFTISITSAKRHTLEDSDLYFDNRNGVLVEVSQHEKKIRRKRGLEKVQNLPGKLDHVSVVAYNVGNFCY